MPHNFLRYRITYSFHFIHIFDSVLRERENVEYSRLQIDHRICY